MHTIEDKKHRLLISHNADWSGSACITWQDRIDYREPERRSHCWVSAPDLLRGDLRPATPEPGTCNTVIPTEIWGRAVALALNDRWCAEITRVAETGVGVWK